MSLTKFCKCFLKLSWASSGTFRGMLNLDTEAFLNLRTRRSLARAFVLHGCSIWLAIRYNNVTVLVMLATAKFPWNVVLLLSVTGYGI